MTRITLGEVPGLDPVGLWLYEGDYAGLCFRDGPELGRDEAVIDLSDAATRDRCLRWLAGRVVLEVGCGAPGWVDSFGGWWVLFIHDDDLYVISGDNYPAIADLDPTDDTRLPDGSRLVDALALAAVLRHVGGAT